MSKLVDQIRACNGQERRALSSPLVSIKDGFERYNRQTASSYRIGVQVEARAFVSDANDGGVALTEAIKTTKESVIEEIFGEFRRPIMHLELALMDQDVEKARGLLRDLRSQMFEPGEGK